MKKNKVLKPLLILCALGIILIVFKFFNLQEGFKNLLEGIRGMGIWGPIVFLIVYIAATVLFIPGSILTLGAGVIYGPLWGSVIVSVSATFGALAAFLAGRSFARKWVREKLEGNQKFKALDEAVGREGWKIVLLTRLSPIFPFNLLNYAFGLTQVNARTYFAASWLGMIPGTVMYVYIGSLIGNIAALGSGRTRTPIEWVFYGLGLIATLAVTIYVTRLARKALAAKNVSPESK